MNRRRGSFLAGMATLFVLVLLSPAPAGAQQGEECEGIPHCGPFEQDPGNPCNGPNDPFCEGGGGGGGGGGSSCATCVDVFIFPDLTTPAARPRVDRASTASSRPSTPCCWALPEASAEGAGEASR